MDTWTWGRQGYRDTCHRHRGKMTSSAPLPRRASPRKSGDNPGWGRGEGLGVGGGVRGAGHLEEAPGGAEGDDLPRNLGKNGEGGLLPHCPTPMASVTSLCPTQKQPHGEETPSAPPTHGDL